jgi:transposase
MDMPKNIISSEKKQECIAYALAHPEINARQLAADLGIGHSTLSKWLSQARVQGVQGANRTLTAEQQRIKDLEKENAHLREVNEIIKKAHVYFVNNPSR